MLLLSILVPARVPIPPPNCTWKCVINYTNRLTRFSFASRNSEVIGATDSILDGMSSYIQLVQILSAMC